MRHSLGQDILNNMFLFFLIIIAELQELPPVCVASLMDVLYHEGFIRICIVIENTFVIKK